VLPEAERRIVVEAWNRTEAEYPADRCIHELFEEQAARAPGAVAVRFGEESLTYGELNERANRLALARWADQIRIGRTYPEQSPEHLLEVSRVWRAIPDLLGPLETVAPS
jgi:non-ribosomal peptide synthetase component F